MDKVKDYKYSIRPLKRNEQGKKLEEIYLIHSSKPSEANLRNQMIMTITYPGASSWPNAKSWNKMLSNPKSGDTLVQSWPLRCTRKTSLTYGTCRVKPRSRHSNQSSSWSNSMLETSHSKANLMRSAGLQRIIYQTLKSLPYTPIHSQLQQRRGSISNHV